MSSKREFTGNLYRTLGSTGARYGGGHAPTDESYRPYEVLTFVRYGVEQPFMQVIHSLLPELRDAGLGRPLKVRISIEVNPDD